MDNIGKKDTFLQTHSLKKLIQEAQKNIKKPITTSEIEAVIKKFQPYKSPGSDGFTGRSYQTVKEELTSILKLLQKIREDGVLPNSFYEASIILVPKSDKDTTKKTTGQYH